MYSNSVTGFRCTVLHLYIVDVYLIKVHLAIKSSCLAAERRLEENEKFS